MIRPIVERVGDELKINLFPKQVDFVNSDLDDLLFGGQAGPGKTTAILMGAALRRMSHPGSIGLILRRTFPELEKSLIQRSREIYPFFGAVYHEANKIWKFPNGSLQYFGYTESDKDVYQFQSAEYQDIWFDEASHFTEFQISYISSRCRSTIPGCKAIIRLASNPGNIGHHYLKKRYIEPGKKQKIWTDPITGKTLGFIPAALEDNPAMMELDPTYKKRLRELGDQKYLALAEGNWEIAEGAYFNFDLRIGYGVLPYRRIPDTDTFKFLSLDWGYSDPACVLWWELMPSGRLICYRELYVTRLSPKELAKRIVEMCPSHERYEHIACSPEIWGKKVELDGGGESIQMLMNSILSDRVPMIKAANARVAGWAKMREYMSTAGDGRPWMQISPICENLIRTIPTMIHDDKNPEDCSGRAEDHACLVGDTKVLTDKGEVNLSAIKVGDKVMTRVGLRTVVKQAMSNPSALIREVLFSDGTILQGTGDHPIWVESKGFTAIDSLRYSDIIMPCENKLKKSQSYLTGLNSTDIPTVQSESFVSIMDAQENTDREVFGGFTKKFGNLFMEKFQRVTTFITKMKIRLITALRIWNVSQQGNIYQITETGQLQKLNSSISIEYDHKQQRGIKILRIINVMLRLARKHGLLLAKEQFLLFARFAVKIIQQIRFQNLTVNFVPMFASQGGAARVGLMTFGSLARDAGYNLSPINMQERSFAQENAPGIYVVSVKKLPKREPVYNITVEEQHEYFANGILVSNCESARYGIMSIANAPQNGSEIISPYEQLFGRTTQSKSYANLPDVGKGGY